jgi:hypothetical protein
MTDCAHKDIVPTSTDETDGKCEKCGETFPIGKTFLSSGKPFYYSLALAKRLNPHGWYGKAED